MNRKLLLFMFFIIFISVASISAVDTNRTDVGFDPSDSRCCSFVIQDGSETVFAFRQDAPLEDLGVIVHNDSWDDVEIIREEIDSNESYFTHAVVTQNGWVFSQGGSHYDDANRDIENIAREMSRSNTISLTSLAKIQNILKDYDYGHVLIKAPDGRYGIVYSNVSFTGTLKSGEYLIVPNDYELYRYGNYANYSADPVDAIVKICSYETSGSNRSNLYVYDYYAHDVDDGQKYGVDFYVTNDNGHNVGLNTSSIVSYFWYNGKFYPASSVPEIPEKQYVATYIFENKSVTSIFELLGNLNSALNNRGNSVAYGINNAHNEKTVVFESDNIIN